MMTRLKLNFFLAGGLIGTFLDLQMMGECYEQHQREKSCTTICGRLQCI